MTGFELKTTLLDPADPLLHAFRAIVGKITLDDARQKIFGSVEKYNLAALAPWSDVSDEDGAKAVAKQTLEALKKHNDQGNKILDTSRHDGEVTIITTCARSLNGITDDNGKIVSRSLADPVDEKHHRLIYEAVHNEIRKDVFKDQVIIMSLSACTYKSNEAGEALQGINGAVRCSDEQLIFSNKSDILYVIQHCDFTQQARDAMGLYSYHEFDILHESAHTENHVSGINARFVGEDKKSSVLDAEFFVPPGKKAAQIVTVQEKRGKGYSGGAHVLVTQNSAYAFNNVAAMKEAQTMITRDVGNSMLGAAEALNHISLEQDPAFVHSIGNQTDARRKLLMTHAELLSVSSPGSLDAWYAAKMLNWSSVPMDAYHDHVVTFDGEIGSLHTLFSRDCTLPTEDMMMTNGGDNRQELSLIQTASFASREELRDVNDHINDNQEQVGERYFSGGVEAFAEAQFATNEMSRRNENPRPRANAFTKRAETQAQNVVNAPHNYPQLPIDTARVDAWTRGELELRSRRGNGGGNGAAGGEHRLRYDPNLSAEERAAERQREEARMREREHHARSRFE